MSRVAVVSGGASGIGAAQSADDWPLRGNKVAIFDLQGDTLKAHVSALREDGFNARGYEVDVTDRLAVGSRGAVATEFGTDPNRRHERRYHLVFEPFTDLSIEQWNRTLAINLTGTFNCVQAAISDMIEAGWGRIVTISSTAGQTAAPGQADYVASKGGVIALTKALASDSPATASP